jgi:hypothetical protein
MPDQLCEPDSAWATLPLLRAKRHPARGLYPVSPLKAETIFLVLIIACLSGWAGRQFTLLERSVPDVEIPSTHSISTCVEKRATSAIQTANMPLAREHLTICIEEVSRHLELNDFQIRRMKFFSQYYAEKVSLWMVVFVTVAGVFLSAFQLWTSYTIAKLSAGQSTDSHELTLETGRIIIKSSAIGLMVLFTSLAFFLVFVINVYKLEEVKQEIRATPLQAAQQVFSAGVLVPFEKRPQPGAKEQNEPGAPN